MRHRWTAMVCAALLWAFAPPAAAQDAELPDFASCIDVEVDQYEWRLLVHRSRDLNAEDFDLWNVTDIEYCGNIAITLCDRTGAPIPCQQRLTRYQHALRRAVMAELPEPMRGQAGFPLRLYEKAYDLALGTSAGPDCDGAGALIATWCETREANGRLKSAILAWQVARYLDLAAPAVAAGWANPPKPVRPLARPEK
ncbi:MULTISPECIES: hypothetical protein [unclassified Marinovum]